MKLVVTVFPRNSWQNQQLLKIHKQRNILVYYNRMFYTSLNGNGILFPFVQPYFITAKRGGSGYHVFRFQDWKEKMGIKPSSMMVKTTYWRPFFYSLLESRGREELGARRACSIHYNHSATKMLLKIVCRASTLEPLERVPSGGSEKGQWVVKIKRVHPLGSIHLVCNVYTVSCGWCKGK